MSKIVCDMCGTSYPETAAQCPICGSAKSETAVPAGDTMTQSAGYAYVKGGRFSHANVKKRNGGKKELPRTEAAVKPVKEKPVKEKPVKEKTVREKTARSKPEKEVKPQQDLRKEPENQVNVQEPAPVAMPRRRPPRKQKKENNIALLIIVILLVIAIVAVLGYITIRLLDINSDPFQSSSSTSQADPSGSSSVSKPQPIPCTKISIQMPSCNFSAVGQTLLLEVTKTPADATDPVTFESSDPYIASVDDHGLIVAVAKGVATITIRCGDQTAVCEINCQLPNDPSYPTEPPKPTESTTQSTAPFVKLELNRKDFTLEGYGSTHNLYSGELDPASITWTSSNESVATVQNGIVTAVGNGMAVITAEYEGQKVTCDVHCNKATKPSFQLSTTDTTVTVGGSFTLRAYIVDEDGNRTRIDPSELTFSTAKEGFITVDENGVVTGVKNNLNYKTIYKVVYVEYNGEVLECIVRVSGE